MRRYTILVYLTLPDSCMCVWMCQSIEALEKHLLDGQKLQGPPTAADVYQCLQQKTTDDRSVCVCVVVSEIAHSFYI